MLPISLEQAREAARRIAPYIHTTPMLPFDYLNTDAGTQVFLKCETFQKTGSFKIRGASNCILTQLDRAKRHGVVAASAGNHAQGVASICQQLGISAKIVMPVLTPALKTKHTRERGAEVILHGDFYDESFQRALEISETEKRLLVHPFFDKDIIAGQSTIALEISEHPLFSELEAIVIPIGGGGLISGCASVLKQLRPQIKIYGVTAKHAPALWQSFKKNNLVSEPVLPTLAEGVAVKKPNETMLKFIQKNVDDIFSLGEESIAHAISLLAEHGKFVVEGAGALPLAAMLDGLITERKVILLLSGGNMDLQTLTKVLQRGLVEQDRMIRLVLRLPDRPGTLHAVTQILSSLRANIMQIYHQRSTLHVAFGEAEVELDLETRGKEHTVEIISALKEAGFKIQRVF